MEQFKRVKVVMITTNKLNIMKNIFKTLLKSCDKKKSIKPMGVIMVGKKLSFNEMGEKQNPALYIHNTNRKSW